MPRTRIHLLFFALAAGCAAAFLSGGPAQQPIQLPGTRTDKLPWHLVDLRWIVPSQPDPVEMISIDMSIENDIQNSIHFFFVPICGKINGQVFYAGLQTRLAEVTIPGGGTLVESSRGIWFTKWGPKEKAAIRPSLKGWHFISDHEGDHVSIRPPFEWRKGQYRFRFTKMDRETVNGKDRTWVGCFVETIETGEHFFAGAIRFEGSALRLDGQLSSFVEICGPVGFDLSPRVPELQVTFSDLRINGKRIDVTSLLAVFPPGVPGYASAKLVKTQPERGSTDAAFNGQPGAVRVTIENKTTVRKEIVERLFDATKSP